MEQRASQRYPLALTRREALHPVIGAIGHGSARATLNALFRHALEVGKRVRTETGLSRHTASVSMAAVAMADDALGGLAGKRVLVLGAGDIGEGMAVALAESGVVEVLVANRTFDRADHLATRLGGRPVRLLELADALNEVDVLLTSTGARSILVEHADLAPVMAARPNRPLLVVDVAVPRDVDPGVASIPGVTLLDIDDLRAFADRGIQERRNEIPAAQGIVDDEVARWIDHSTAREVAPLIAAMGLVAPAPGFLEGLRKACDAAGTLLVFDEVITGFRLGAGGAQQHYGVTPDLTCFGKVIGGGIPVGAFGGRADVMDVLAPLGPVYQAGTLSGNPLATAAGLAVLGELDDGVYMPALPTRCPPGRFGLP